MNCSFQVNEIPKPSCQTGHEASENERSLQTDPNKSEHDAMPRMESFGDILTQPRNVDFQLDDRSLRNVDLANISGLESFGSILSEPDSATGQTVPKFRPKMSTRSKAVKLENFSNTNVAQESTSLGDSLPLDTEQLEGHNHVEMSSLEIGSPGV